MQHISWRISKSAMGIIKQLREHAGYTQLELSEKTGLSLRMIQRLEASDKAPRGHSLKMLSEVFHLEPFALQDKFQSIQNDQVTDSEALK